MKPLSDTELKQILNDARLEINFRGYVSSTEQICEIFRGLFYKLSGKLPARVPSCFDICCDCAKNCKGERTSNECERYEVKI